MNNIRLIARLDIKGKNVIKGVHLEGLRVVGSPSELALKYYNQGIDELIYMDSVASLYGRNHLSDIVKIAAKNIFVPITVGGGLRNIEDVDLILRSGADKVAINTAAIFNPSLITQVALKYGSQCMVLSIEAKKSSSGEQWEAYTDNGRERTAINVVDWAIQAEKLGAGEILLTSVDMEGTRKGFDLPLLKAVTSEVTIPVICSGGMGSSDHLIEAVTKVGCNAVAMADVLHYDRINLTKIRNDMKNAGLPVRIYEK